MSIAAGTAPDLDAGIGGLVHIDGVEVPGRGAESLYVLDGRLVSAATHAAARSARPGTPVFDGSGWLALPRLVEAHVHVDKTLLGEPWRPHLESAELGDRIRVEIDALAADDVAPIADRARRLVDVAVGHGATRMRSHVDISGEDPQLDTKIEVMLALRDALGDLVELTLVAFPQRGIAASPGTGAALERALAAGFDTIGGLDPATFDADRAAHLDVVFGLAARFGVDVDIHLHERGAVGLATLAAIADRTDEADLGGRVAVSHAYCLADAVRAGGSSSGELGPVVDRLAAAGITVITSAPGEGLMPPIDELVAGGVNVVAASDNINDSWSPFGTGDPLERAGLVAYLAGWRSDARLGSALAMVTDHAERALGHRPRRLVAGEPADVTLIEASVAAEAVARRPPKRIVLRAGRLVAGGQHLAGRVRREVRP